MRETWAKVIVLLTGFLVLLLAYLFAHNQNIPHKKIDEATIPLARSIDAQLSEQELTQLDAGRRVFEREDCRICHSIDGKGNPSNPLDGVGKKLTVSEIRQWITATNGIDVKLSSSIANRKKSYSKLPPEDLDDLIFYLQHQQ